MLFIINRNDWVCRSERVGYLQIDGAEAVEGISPGSMKQLTTFGTIFIGTHQQEELRLLFIHSFIHFI